MSRLDDEIRATEHFRGLMLKKLRENHHKAFWRGSTYDYLMLRLREELVELSLAIMDEGPENIQLECADVANFAMMIADNARHDYLNNRSAADAD